MGEADEIIAGYSAARYHEPRSARDSRSQQRRRQKHELYPGPPLLSSNDLFADAHFWLCEMLLNQFWSEGLHQKHLPEGLHLDFVTFFLLHKAGACSAVPV